MSVYRSHMYSLGAFLAGKKHMDYPSEETQVQSAASFHFLRPWDDSDYVSFIHRALAMGHSL